MSYSTVEDALLAVIRLLANYTTANTSKGDYRILGHGVSRAVVLQPGPFEREVVAATRRIRTRWTIYAELYIPFTGEVSTIADNIRSDRQELLDHLDKYPTLNHASGVVSAFVTGATEPEVWLGEQRRWWRQVLRIEVEERSTATIAE